MRSSWLIVALVAMLCGSYSLAQSPLDSEKAMKQVDLIAIGAAPFHLKATITEDRDSSPIEVEMWWKNQSFWRRTIQSEDYSEVRINGSEGRAYEDHQDHYYPVPIEAMVSAMLGRLVPPFLEMRPQFGDFQDFMGKSVPRTVSVNPLYSPAWTVKITQLEALKENEGLFSIPQDKPSDTPILIETLPERDFLDLAIGKHEIIWPQVLDGKTTGAAVYFVTVDRDGNVREVYPMAIDNERANESVCRQIKAWKFKPLMKFGKFPAQTQAILSFSMDTRAWGPLEPLSDEQVRRLATDITEPVIPSGIAPSGTVKTLRVAVDEAGKLIEVIGGDGPGALFSPCYRAILQWHFKPVLENGEPRPYRGELQCVVP